MTHAEAGVPHPASRRGGLLLHGRQRTSAEMLALAARLPVDRIHWVAPQASRGSWYPYRYLDPIARNEPALSASLAVCEAGMREVSDDGRIPPEGLAIVGFSQGACVASEYVLRHPGCCRVLVMFTGGVIGPELDTWRRAGIRLEGTRVLITGSDTDDWIPEARTRESAALLEALGADVRLRIYEGRRHQVSEAELVEAHALLTSALAA